jgi:hypothetical protein
MQCNAMQWLAHKGVSPQQCISNSNAMQVNVVSPSRAICAGAAGAATGQGQAPGSAGVGCCSAFLLTCCISPLFCQANINKTCCMPLLMHCNARRRLRSSSRTGASCRQRWGGLRHAAAALVVVPELLALRACLWMERRARWRRGRRCRARTVQVGVHLCGF